MAEAMVRAKALRWVSDDFPGWIEVSLVDAGGHEHRIIEKVPVLTDRGITAASAFPAEFWVRADAGEVKGDMVAVVFAYSVETIDGCSDVSMSTADVRWL